LEIHRQCNVDLSVGHIKENPNVALLSAIVDKLNINKHNEQKTALPVTVKDFYPVSTMQHFFLTNAVLDPEDVSSNVSLTLTLSINTDAAKLKDAITKTITAHPGMSATFIRDGNKFLLKRNEPNIHIETSELTDEEFEKRKLAFPKLFNVFQDDRLYRIEICKTPSTLKLLFDIHHSIFDGMSQMIFLSDVANIYAGGSLQPETDTFFDAAEEESKILASEKKQKATAAIVAKIENYGNAAQLIGAELKTGTLLDIDIASTPLFAYAALPQQSPLIHYLCEKKKTGANTFFAAVFAVTISQITSRNKMMFAHTISGRSTARKQRIIGPFAKGIPLFIDFSDKNNKTNDHLLRHVDNEIAESTRYSDLNIMELFKDTIPLVYLFHSSLLDPKKMPVIEGQRIMSEFIPKSRMSRVAASPLIYIVNEDENIFKITLLGNSNVFSQEFVNDFLAKLIVNIDKLITGNKE
jgi:hypothetical protein